jgi:hypothetical protein
MANPLASFLASEKTLELKPADPAPADPIPAPVTDPISPANPLPDKFQGKSPEEIVAIYQQLEQRLGQQGQELGELRKFRQETEAKLTPPAPAAPEPPPAEPKPSPEEIEKLNEKLLADFYENPSQTLESMAAKMAEKIVEQKLGDFQKKLEPLEQAQAQQQAQQAEVAKIVETNQRRNSFIQEVAKKSDFKDFQPAIAKMAAENPQLFDVLEQAGVNPVEYAYNSLKAEQAKTPEQLLQDTDFRQKILADPNIRTEIIKGHAEAIKKGQPPVVIGSQPAGSPPAAPPIEIKSVRDGTKAAASFFQRFTGAN